MKARPDPARLRRRAVFAVYLRDVEGRTIRAAAEEIGVSMRTLVKLQAEGRRLVGSKAVQALKAVIAELDAQADDEGAA